MKQPFFHWLMMIFLIAGVSQSIGCSDSDDEQSKDPGIHGLVLDNNDDPVADAGIHLSQFLTASPGVAQPASPLQDDALGQNYPNPFVTITTIPYSVSFRNNVRLIIYDWQGEVEYVELLNETHDPGHYNYIWNGKNGDGQSLPNGVYRCEMRAGNFQQDRLICLDRPLADLSNVQPYILSDGNGAFFLDAAIHLPFGEAIDLTNASNENLGTATLAPEIALVCLKSGFQAATEIVTIDRWTATEVTFRLSPTR